MPGDSNPILYVALAGFQRAVFKADCEWNVTSAGALNVTMPRQQPGPLKKLATFADSDWKFCEVGHYDDMRQRHRDMAPKTAAEYDERMRARIERDAPVRLDVKYPVPAHKE